MTNSEWIAIVSVLVIVIGWFLNSELNRRNEIAKKRLEFRLDILNLMLDTFNDMQEHIITTNSLNGNNKLVAALYRALSRLAFFGKQDEKILCEVISKKMNDKQPIGLELSKLIEVVSRRIKKELKFK